MHSTRGIFETCVAHVNMLLLIHTWLVQTKSPNIKDDSYIQKGKAIHTIHGTLGNCPVCLWTFYPCERDGLQGSQFEPQQTPRCVVGIQRKLHECGDVYNRLHLLLWQGYSATIRAGSDGSCRFNLCPLYRF